MKITKPDFGASNTSHEVCLYKITNSKGMSVSVCNYGGIISSIEFPSKENKVLDVVLGASDISEYLKPNPYIGCLVGRYANRIAQGKFSIKGKDYQLVVNNGKNHLHGGTEGFDKKFWKSEEFHLKDEAGVILTYQSKDMEEGYPGNLLVSVAISINEANELKLVYEAESDQTTIINLTHHGYFNLEGHDSESVLDHQLYVNANQIVDQDSDLFASGKLLSVKDTAFDFLTSKKIGLDIEKTGTLGYDHCYALNKKDINLPEICAKLYAEKSGIEMQVFTTEPGLQVYSSNYLNGNFTGKNGIQYKAQSAVCLETQHFPDSVHHSSFPSVILEAGMKYSQITIYKFSTIF